ncbi:CBS domain-containing protein [Mangrovibrevibacter kandeliae]|uniref:CBS domain-containing protein n=1 Tax=Mangrovibrevibacter kandeliae TaxID=2968473 RepID=UPI002117F3D9|nr:CBS domain-containing protein [Aurantimonas sp. CSK15Z-1]MCQ8782700.1 CBS domain-containing protein [Aurantimonas sp. CSK15Z-1]
MNVGNILEEKGRDVVTLRPTVTIGEAIGVLAEKRIGAVVLTDEAGEVAGILSERDVVRILAAKGAESFQETVADAMTPKVVTCGEATTLDELMDIMTRGRFRHVPVLQDGRLAGIVSIGDVVKRRIETAEREAEEIRQYIATA